MFPILHIESEAMEPLLLSTWLFPPTKNFECFEASYIEEIKQKVYQLAIQEMEWVRLMEDKENIEPVIEKQAEKKKRRRKNNKKIIPPRRRKKRVTKRNGEKTLSAFWKPNEV